MAVRGEPCIVTQGLTKHYGTKIAVNNLDLTVRRGEVFGLLGPNGAGKTTTILMLLGLTEPTAGKAEILGLDCARNPLRVKSVVGYLPDSVGFYGDMTGRENLRFTGRLNGLDGKELEERIDRLIERVGMEEAADRRTETYSRGMKQRLGIADVLIKNPEIIIMDEPTLGIDPEGMRELLAMIRRLSEEDGITILISSHQLHQIQQVCDRVGIFVEGRLVATGTLGELEEQIRRDSNYILEVETAPCDDRLLGMIGRQEGVLDIRKEGSRFIITSTTDFREQLTGFLGTNGYTILHLHQRGGDLDEIYHRYFEKAEKEERDGTDRPEKGRSFGRRKK